MVRKRTKQQERTSDYESELLKLGRRELLDLLGKVCGQHRLAQLVSATEDAQLRHQETRTLVVASLLPRERDHAARLLRKERIANPPSGVFQ